MGHRYGGDEESHNLQDGNRNVRGGRECKGRMRRAHSISSSPESRLRLCLRLRLRSQLYPVAAAIALPFPLSASVRSSARSGPPRTIKPCLP